MTPEASTFKSGDIGFGFGKEKVETERSTSTIPWLQFNQEMQLS